MTKIDMILFFAVCALAVALCAWAGPCCLNI